MQKIRTLIIDDSALARRSLVASLQPFPEIEVIGAAINCSAAQKMIDGLRPDVLTLDLEMPGMDGLTFLRWLMKERPIPVIVVSSLTTAGSEKALEALEAGALDVLDKPNGPYSAYENGWMLAEKIKAAMTARLIRPSRSASPHHGVVVRDATAEGMNGGSPRSIILMGASTGGVEALKTVLTTLPTNLPGICIVQHIPPYFSAAFANRLNAVCQLEVREAQNGDRVLPGTVLIAPGGYHLVLHWRGAGHTVELSEGPKIHYQRPAVDVLFRSAGRTGSAPDIIAVLLTGMGVDGAAGLLELRNAGAATIVQNEETCVVFGMPREAIRLEAADHILPLQTIPHKIKELCARLSTKRKSPAKLSVD